MSPERVIFPKLEPGALVTTDEDLTECDHKPMLIINARRVDSLVVHVTAADEAGLNDGEWLVESVKRQLKRVL